jgi:FkbM family methyltransferase
MAKVIAVSDKQYKYRFVCETYHEAARANSFFIKEPGTVEWISSFKSDSIFYDIGANIGTYSLYGSKRSAYVYAFEPHVGTCMSLLRNIKINNIKNIEVVSAALHDKCGFINFYYYADEAGSTNSQLSETDVKFPSTNTELKYAVTIDQLIDMKAIKPATHVKIDVDGNELLIIKGMTKLLASRTIESLQVELGPNRLNEAANILQQYGYKMIKQHYTNNGLLALSNGVEGVLLNIIYARV